MSVIGHGDRAKPLRDHCAGLMMSGERKSVEPMAALTAPTRAQAQAQHQSLLHVVGSGPIVAESNPRCRVGHQKTSVVGYFCDMAWDANEGRSKSGSGLFAWQANGPSTAFISPDGRIAFDSR